MKRRIKTVPQLMRYLAQPDKRVPLPELDDVSLPIALPGEVLKPRGSDFDIGYYSPDGERLPGDLLESTSLVWSVYKRDPANRRRSETFYRSGVPINVSTIYLGLDHGWGDDGPPIMWETMVFVGGRGDAFTARYATRAAAFAGHTVVTSTIRAAQRARRQAWQQRPTRQRTALA